MPCAVHGGAALSVALCPAHMPFPSIIISQSWDARKQQDPLINNQKTNGYQTESPIKKSPAARLSVTLLAQFPSQKWWMKSLSIVLAEYPLVQAHRGIKCVHAVKPSMLTSTSPPGVQGCNQRRSLFFSIKCSPYVLNNPRHTQHEVILRLHLPAPVLLGTANVFICLTTYTQAPLTCASLSEATSFASHSTWRVCGDDGDDFSVALHEHDRLKCHTDS